MRYRTSFASFDSARDYLAEQRFRSTTLLANNAFYNAFVSTGAIVERCGDGYEVNYYDLYDSREANRFRVLADRDAA